MAIGSRPKILVLAHSRVTANSMLLTVPKVASRYPVP